MFLLIFNQGEERCVFGSSLCTWICEQDAYQLNFFSLIVIGGCSDFPCIFVRKVFLSFFFS